MFIKLSVLFVMALIFSAAYADSNDTLLHKLQPEPADFGGQNAEFGTSIDIDGNVAAIGSEGAVHIFELVGSQWEQQATLIPENTDTRADFYGASVSISGNRVVVGAPKWRSAEQSEFAEPILIGKAYLFEKIGEDWTLIKEFVPPESRGGDFGSVVKIYHDEIVVSSPLHHQGSYLSGIALRFSLVDGEWENTQTFTREPGFSNSCLGLSIAMNATDLMLGSCNILGQVSPNRIAHYKKINSEWNFQGFIQLTDTAYVSKLTAIEINDDIMAVGSPYDSDGLQYSGAVYVYENINHNWMQTSKIKLENPLEDQHFGYTLDVLNDQIVIASRADRSIEYPDIPNLVYVYQKNTDWELSSTLDVYNEGNNFRPSPVQFNGHQLLVGTPTAGEQRSSGIVSVLEPSSTNQSWNVTEELSVNGAGGTTFGFTLSRDGDTMTIRSASGFYRSSSILIYELVDDVWIKSTSLRPNVPVDRDDFGTSIKLLGDRLLVGAPTQRSVHADDQLPGSAYLFEKNNGKWVQTSHFQSSQLEPNDHFGYSIDMDQNTLVIGAPNADNEQGNGRGVVYIYSLIDDSWTLSNTLLDSFYSNYNRSFGHQVVLDGDRLTVSNPDGRYGILYSYIKNTDDDWQLEQKIYSDDWNIASHIDFGKTLDVSGEWLAIGAPDFDIHNSNSEGAIVIYRLNHGLWEYFKEITAPVSAPRDLGMHVKLHNNRLVYRSHRSYLFDEVTVMDFINDDWIITSQIRSPEYLQSIFLGRAIHFNGDDLVLGAPGLSERGPGSGAVYHYEIGNPENALNDSIVIQEDAGQTLLNVLDNDFAEPLSSLTITNVTPANHGIVSLANNQVTYEPENDYCNDQGSADTFTYTLSGGTTASVGVWVACVDDAPVAEDDSILLTKNLSATEFSVLTNDTDIDAGPMLVSSVTQPSNGTVVNANTHITYEPDLDYCNDGVNLDTFTYTLNGGSIATVSAHVTCEDILPTAANDDYTILEDDPTIQLNVLTNDENPDLGPFFIESVSAASHGQLINNNQFLEYTTDADYCSEGFAENITYTLNGGSQGQITITTLCVNDQPTFTTGETSFIYEPNPNGVIIQVPNWITSIDLGSVYENIDQSVLRYDFLSVLDTHSNVNSASITQDGSLSIELGFQANEIILDVTLVDDGGTLNNGVDTSDPVRLTISPVDFIFSDNFDPSD